jgi:UTP:GlnB (protein PII) uridylyltransferase
VTVVDDYRDALARRRAAVTRLIGGAEVERVAMAPPGYLLAHASGDIARHVGLLATLPGVGEVRVVATPGKGAGTWHLDMATRDRPGVLAAFTGVLAAHHIDVVQAVAATWYDGAALEAFVVRAATPPDPHALQPELAASLRQPLTSDPVDDARLCFDNDASALFTRCDLRAGDRPGLLHAIAVAFATAGADVHAARVATVAHEVHDVFDLSDRAGRKLDPVLQHAIAAHLRTGT